MTLDTIQENELVPVQLDPMGDEAFTARYEQNRTLKLITAMLTALLIASVSVNGILAMRKPIVRYIRIDEVGKAQAIAYNDLNYTPREGEVRRELEDWTKARYVKLRATVAETYHLNYNFVDQELAHKKMQQDLLSQEIPRIMNGVLPENDVRVNSIQFLSLGRQSVRGSVLTAGQAMIDFTKLYTATNSQPARREHWVSSVTFYLNPQEVAAKSEKDPQYETVNPLGLCITDFHEARVLN